MSGFIGVLMALATGQIGCSIGLTNVSAATGVRTSTFTLVSDGTTTRTPTGGGTAIAGPNWYTPTSAGIGSSYWVKFVVNSNTNSNVSGTVNSVMAVSGANWSFSNSATNVEGSGNGSLYFYSDSGGTNLVGTGSVSWDVGYTP